MAEIINDVLYEDSLSLRFDRIRNAVAPFQLYISDSENCENSCSYNVTREFLVELKALIERRLEEVPKQPRKPGLLERLNPNAS